jgi:hypothetical protein
VRAFVKMRELLATHKQLAQKLAELERKVGAHDLEIRSLIAHIRKLATPPDPRQRRIGLRRQEPAT